MLPPTHGKVLIADERRIANADVRINNGVRKGALVDQGCALSQTWFGAESPVNLIANVLLVVAVPRESSIARAEVNDLTYARTPRLMDMTPGRLHETVWCLDLTPL
jgi:hypothetical protein